jgi:uncharacterized glyoxalase superfamily protein PhnB
MHKPPPPGWPQLSPGLYYRRPAEAIDFLCCAFGFEIRLKIEGEVGEIVHAEVTYGQALVMISGEGARPGDDPSQAWRRLNVSPLSVEGRNTQGLCLYVDDADAHCATARAQGATVFAEPATHDYGDDYWADRSYGACDLEGNMWWFSQRLRNEPGAPSA